MIAIPPSSFEPGCCPFLPALISIIVRAYSTSASIGAWLLSVPSSIGLYCCEWLRYLHLHLNLTAVRSSQHWSLWSWMIMVAPPLFESNCCLLIPALIFLDVNDCDTSIFIWTWLLSVPSSIDLYCCACLQYLRLYWSLATVRSFQHWSLLLWMIAIPPSSSEPDCCPFLPALIFMVVNDYGSSIFIWV
jgi:hypothetical protein